MILTAKEISERLSQQCESVCRELLPHGKISGGRWHVGSVGGDPGKSMSVQLAGARAGVWADFANSAEDSGDLLDLWAKVRNISLGQAIKEAKSFLRISDPVPTNPVKKYSRPAFGKGMIKVKDGGGNTDVEKYLVYERKLMLKTILDYRVAQFDHPVIGRSIVFPSRNAEDTAWIAAKYIALERDENGKKKILNEKDQAPCLFGWQVAEKGSRTVLITEGQIDAMTWHSWGLDFPALSIPNGTGDVENWIDFEWDNLAQFDTIYLSFDMDDPGRKATVTVANRLGIHRCMVVRLPHNDANECLQKGCTAEDAAKWISAAKPIQPQEIKTPMDYRDRIKAMENPDPGVKPEGFIFSQLGERCPFIPGDVTIWTGFSFHGKSTMLNQLMVEAAVAGERGAIGSFEMPGELTCVKAAKCLAFRPKLTDEEIDACLNFFSGRIWIYDVIGIITEKKLFDLMTYSVMRHGVKYIIIDSLMKCDISSEDYEAQRQLLNKLIEFAQRCRIHIHIVAHPKKHEDDAKPPDVMDIHGGQAVSGQPGNIISVWKNTKKADAREDGKLGDEKEKKEPDTVACVRKHRSTGNRYKVQMWFHRKTYRFTTKTDEDSGLPFFENYNAVALPHVQEGI